MIGMIGCLSSVSRIPSCVCVCVCVIGVWVGRYPIWPMGVVHKKGVGGGGGIHRVNDYEEGGGRGTRIYIYNNKQASKQASKYEPTSLLIPPPFLLSPFSKCQCQC